jgi:hypothetical protein
MILPRLYNQKTVQELRNKRLFQYGSESLSVTITDLTTGLAKVYGFENDANIRKYLPLNYLRIQNKSGADLKVYVGQKANGEIILDDTTFTYYGNFFSFKLENIDTVTATGSTCYCDVQRKPSGG